MVKIFMDPGHGGSDPGAVGNGLQEKNLTLTISRKIRDKLKDYENVQVRLSREGDQTLSLSARANMANAWGADYFMSIHINSAAGTNGTGFETFIWNGNVSSKTIANQNVIHPEIVKATGFRDRGKKRANFLVIRTTRMPAILTECGFINNPVDANKLKQDSFLDKIAQGHVNGVVKAFGLKKRVDNSSASNMKPSDDKSYRLMTGTFANAEQLANAVKMVKRDFGWLVYEAPDSTKWNPTYRLFTGSFVGKNVAEHAAQQLKDRYGWNVYVREA